MNPIATPSDHTRTSEVARDVTTVLSLPSVPELPKPPAPARTRDRALLVLGFAALLGGLLATGIIARVRHGRTLAAEALHVEPASVKLLTAAPSLAPVEISLPGDVRAYEETGLHARASGYVKRWLADLGDHVAAGQLLAEIETPELEQDLVRARAALAQAAANRDLAAAANARWGQLLEKHAVSQQDYDEHAAALAARVADYRAAEAAVQRLEQVVAFDRIIAPFDGVITARNIEVGALVSAGDSRELFHLAQASQLRVYLDVPQGQVRSIRVGQSAVLSLREYPGRVISGRVSRLAGALDAATRTMRVEVLVDNGDGTLVPGLHADVKLSLPRTEPVYVVPATAVIVRQGPPQIATLGADNVAHLQTVLLGRDFGATIEVLSGLSAGARVVADPTDTLRDGDVVRVATPSSNPS